MSRVDVETTRVFPLDYMYKQVEKLSNLLESEIIKTNENVDGLTEELKTVGKFNPDAVEEFTAVNGQTVFTLTNAYELGKNDISVEIDRVPQRVGQGYEETSVNSITLSEPATVGAKIRIVRHGITAAEDERLDLYSGILENTVLELGGKAKQTDLSDLVLKHSNFVKAKYETLPFKRTHYFLYDSFARADSASSVGNCETDNTAYTFASAGTGVTWGILNNQVYNPSFTTAGRSLMYKETNESDGIVEVDVTLVDPNTQYGLAARITDVNNFLYLVIAPGFIQLAKYVASTSTLLFTSNKTYTSGKLSLMLKGSKIEIYMDGFFVGRVYDSFNSTATKHGLYSRGDNANFKWDNLCVKPLSDLPFILNETFENSILPWYWSKETPGQSYSQTFSTVIKESGNQALRIELHKDDPDVNGSKRCEIVLPSENPLEEHWYGVSVYLPNGGIEDFVNDIEPEILIQWHTTPDSSEVDVSPPLSLQTINGRYRIVQNSDAGRISTQSSPFSLTQTITDIGSYVEDKGTWVQWAFHVKWGWLSKQSPITEVYKNGQLVYKNNGVANMTNDQIGIYQKLGVYKWVWHDPATVSTTIKRVVYYDNYWMK